MRLKLKYLPAVIIFLLVFSVYLYTLSPTVSPAGDSGELIAVVHTFGVAHPPGYPLYTLLGKLFTLIPLGTIAFRMNLMSAVFEAATVVLIYFLLLKITKNVLPSFFAALVLAFSYTFWLYGLIAEVFALNNFLAGLLTLLIVSWWLDTRKRKKYLLVASFLLGLSLSHHHTIILLLPSFLYLLFLNRRKIPLNFKFLSLALFLFFLGLVSYFYLTKAGQDYSPVAWSYPQNFSDFWRLFTRADYGTFSPLAGKDPSLVTIENKLNQIINLIEFSLDDFTLVGIILAVAGLGFALMKKRQIAIFLFLAYFTAGVFFVSYADFPITENPTGLNVTERFYLLPFIFLGILIGLGFDFLMKLSRRRFVLRFLPFPCFLLFAAYLFSLNYPLVSQRNNFEGGNLGGNILKTVDKNAMLILQNDIPLFTAMYVRYVENIRPDTDLLTGNFFKKDNNFKYLRKARPDLNFSSGGATSAAILLRKNLKNIPFYSNVPPPSPYKDLEFLRNGLLFRVYFKDATPSASELKKINEEIISSYKLPSKEKIEKEGVIANFAVYEVYMRMFGDLGDYFLINGDYPTAVNYYKKALIFGQDNLTANFRLGQAYQGLKKCPEAKDQYEKTLSLNSKATWVYENLAYLYKNCFLDEEKAQKYEQILLEKKKEKEGAIEKL